jgi:hypothetical protein
MTGTSPEVFIFNRCFLNLNRFKVGMTYDKIDWRSTNRGGGDTSLIAVEELAITRDYIIPIFSSYATHHSYIGLDPLESHMEPTLNSRDIMGHTNIFRVPR